VETLPIGIGKQVFILFVSVTGVFFIEVVELSFQGGQCTYLGI
jgi:hypothetical protein